MRYVILLALIVFGASAYFLDQEKISASKILHPSGTQSGKATSDKALESFYPKDPVAPVDPIDALNPLDPNELLASKGGVVYKSINDSSHNPELLKQLQLDLDNFKKFGSIGKGKTIIEFERTQDYKDSLSKKGIASIIDGLAFNPVHLVNVVGSDYTMIGADDQGKFIPSKGWNGFFQTFEDASTGRQIELSESQAETLLGDEIEVIEEFLNDKVGDVRASVQAMKDPDGKDVYSIQWDDGDRSFTLNTKSFSREESVALATLILNRYRLLPHKGWKSPYVLDPSNPLHRIALQRNKQQINSGPK